MLSTINRNYYDHTTDTITTDNRKIIDITDKYQQEKSSQTINTNTCAPRDSFFESHKNDVYIYEPIKPASISVLPSQDSQEREKKINNLTLELKNHIYENPLRAMCDIKHVSPICDKILSILMRDGVDSQKTAELHDFAYSVFSGTDVANKRSWDQKYSGDAYGLLAASFYIEFSPCEIASLFLVCSAMSKLDKHTIELPGMLDTVFSLPGHNGDDLIEISHGGGYHYLTENFLTAKSDDNSKIWVTPHHEAIRLPGDRDTLYALRTPLRHCDVGGILTADIPMKFLRKTNNNYELILSNKDVAQLQNVNVRKLDKDFIKSYAPQSISNLVPLFILERNSRQKEVMSDFKKSLQDYGLKLNYVDKLISKTQKFVTATLSDD